MNKAYTRIDWENYPSVNTPINESNLNKMDASIDEVDNRVISLDTSKATKTEVATLVADVRFDESTGVFTVQKKNGATYAIDTKLEKITTNWTFDKDKQQIVLTLDDGTKQYIDLSALITQYEFLNSDTITFVVQADGSIKAEVLDGSITDNKIEGGYLAQIKVETSKSESYMNSASKSATSANNSANLSKSYAVGGTGTRENEDTDNAMYYYEQAKQTDIGQISSKVDEVNSNLDTLAYGENAGGANIWDEVWEVYGNTIRSSYIGANASSKYYINNNYQSFKCFDESYNDLGETTYAKKGNGYVITTLANTRYIRFVMPSTYGTIYKNDIIVSVGENETSYKPYIPSVKMLAEENAQQSTEAMDLKMLGWTVPSECPIQNYVDSDGVFHQRVGRVDLGTVAYVKTATGSGKTYYRFIAPNCKYDYDNNTAPNYYLDGYQSVSYNETWFDKCISRQLSTAVILDFAYNDTSAIKNGMKGKYFYYELETPITMIIDGNEVAERLNESLADYGLDNKFDGNYKQGYRTYTDGQMTPTASSGHIYANQIYNCKSGDTVRIVCDDDTLGNINIVTNTNNYHNVSNTKENEWTIPSGVTQFSFYISKSGGITPSKAPKTSVYINNAIDELKNDLVNKELPVGSIVMILSEAATPVFTYGEWSKMNIEPYSFDTSSGGASSRIAVYFYRRIS